ncbi:Hypothetical predicted protein [Octopus vulgaris]|uniref:Uncharacterized protein n=1 Tax=Octopus vulgaris TaxID=6645 RepID=A0AA36FEL2_OCTVU|nr:Hypothetical predicted protein [Octopus vulgaris]
MRSRVKLYRVRFVQLRAGCSDRSSPAALNEIRKIFEVGGRMTIKMQIIRKLKVAKHYKEDGGKLDTTAY